MAFTFELKPRDFTSLPYALYRVRQISGDKRPNPPFSLEDEEWTEHLEDTKLGDTYQVFSAVWQAVATDPTRLESLTEVSGAYQFSDLEGVKASLKAQQDALNETLGVRPTPKPSRGFQSLPAAVVL